MSKKSIVRLIILGIFVGLFVAGIAIWMDLPESGTPRAYRYVGKELMSEEEYTKFKEVVARRDVVIVDLSAYSSDSPLVIFNVEVPAGIDFPWGGVHYTWYNHPWRHFSNVAFILGFLGMAGVICWRITD